jgi:CrcB protein
MHAPRRDRPHRVAAHLDVLAAVAAGGAVGSLARWAVQEAMAAEDATFPWATMVENVTGAFLLGVVMVLALEVLPPSRYLRPFLGVGLLGGFTTFSTYALDIRGLVADGRVGAAGGYLVGTLLLALCAVWAGAVTARAGTLLLRRRP